MPFGCAAVWWMIAGRGGQRNTINLNPPADSRARLGCALLAANRLGYAPPASLAAGARLHGMIERAKHQSVKRDKDKHSRRGSDVVAHESFEICQ